MATPTVQTGMVHLPPLRACRRLPLLPAGVIVVLICSGIARMCIRVRSGNTSEGNVGLFRLNLPLSSHTEPPGRLGLISCVERRGSEKQRITCQKQLSSLITCYLSATEFQILHFHSLSSPVVTRPVAMSNEHKKRNYMMLVRNVAHSRHNYCGMKIQQHSSRRISLLETGFLAIQLEAICSWNH
jgi:hypothetical protein